MVFITALESTEFDNPGKVERFQTIEVSEDRAEELIKSGQFAEKAWECPKCREIHKLSDKNVDGEPPLCPTPHCDSTTLLPLHPTSHDEIGNTLIEEYIFKTMKENKEIYHYTGEKVFESKTTEGLIEEKTKEMKDDCRNRKQKEVVEHIRSKTREDKENFGLPKEKIAVENGILNIKERELEDFDPEKEIPLSKIPVSYDPEAECPKILNLLNDIFKGEDIPLIQEFVGYTLWKKYPYAKALVLLGDGANGKSTFINLLIKFLGEENISSDSLQSLLSKETVRKDLFGKLANLTAETPTALSDTDKFKKITGDDYLKGRRLYQEGFKFKNYAKLIFAANELPETNDDTHAFFRRIILVDCPYRFTKNPDDNHKDADSSLPESILSDEELSGFLNWALDGLDRLFEQDGFSENKTRDEIKERWIRQTDPEKGFIEKHLQTDYDKFIVRSDIHEAYKDYCENHDLESKDQGPLTKEINRSMPSASKYQPKINNKRKRCFKNISLKGEYSEYNRDLPRKQKDDNIVDEGQETIDNVTPERGNSQKNHCERENSNNKNTSSQNTRSRVTEGSDIRKEIKELLNENDLDRSDLIELLADREDDRSVEDCQKVVDQLISEGKLIESVNNGILEWGDC